MLKHKKAQVGESVTWIIATLIIIGVITIFIYISFLMAQTKNIDIANLQSGAIKNLDTVSQKTNFANQLENNKNKEIIDNLLKNENS
jgi:hypothetical protein